MKSTNIYLFHNMQYTGSWGNRFQETHGIRRSTKNLLKLYHFSMGMRSKQEISILKVTLGKKGA